MPDEDESGGFSVLDKNGRLFGLVNVVDLLVVLLVVAVVVAGAALLLGGGAGEADSRYATIDLGTQSNFVAEQITPGDEFEPEGTSHSITITDVYRSEQEGGVHVTVRARVNGTTMDPDEPDDSPTFQFRGEPVRLGRTLTIQTEDYEVDGNVTQLEQTGEQLPTQQTEFVIESSLRAGAADEIAVGDRFNVSGNTVAEVTALRQFPGNGTDQRSVLLGISGQGLDRDGVTEFGGQPLRVGNTVPFNSEGYELRGEIVRRGTSEIDTGTRTVTLRIDNIRPDQAAVIEEGLTTDVRGETVAQITSKRTESAEIVLESEGGDIFLREHPRNLDVEVDIELTVRELADGTARFRGEPLRSGESLAIDFGSVRTEGEILRISD
ncbi:DUF4330 family protein [Halobacteriaceae archaeon SHR40]|uniref:DUF4330 family protein n=1 Tax=Halovenus amylolytica TaxID=2500550 RepID=UPI000FE43D82